MKGVLITLAALFGAAAGPARAGEDLANVYRIEARFDPATGALSATGAIRVVADARRDSIELLLNKALTVGRFSYGDGRTAVIERDVIISGHALPRTQRIRLPLERPLEKGASLDVRFAYAGRLTTDNIEIGRGVVSPRWTELTMEALWYPVWLDEPLVRSEVALSVPERYQVIAPGQAERMGPGRWRLDPLGPVSGRITFALSDSWTIARRPLGPGLSAALYTAAPEPRADDILGAVGGAYAFYQRLFGPPRTRKTAISLLYANRPVGLKYPNQAYSTAGDFIVLDDSPARVQQDTLHHEVAHLWWSAGRPGTPDEFMSESVSEYLALRRGQVVWGQGWLGERRAKMGRDSAAIQARFTELDGFGGPRQPLLYNRGPAALWSLHDRLGARAMNRLLRAAYDGRVETLDGFIALIGKHHGPETAVLFDQRL